MIRTIEIAAPTGAAIFSTTDHTYKYRPYTAASRTRKTSHKENLRHKNSSSLERSGASGRNDIPGDHSLRRAITSNRISAHRSNHSAAKENETPPQDRDTPMYGQMQIISDLNSQNENAAFQKYRCPVDIHRQKKAPTFQSRLCVRVTYFHGQSPGNYRRRTCA